MSVSTDTVEQRPADPMPKAGPDDADDQPSPAADTADDADNPTVDGAADEPSIEPSDETSAIPSGSKARIAWSRVAVYGVLPALALLLAMAAGWLKWQDSSVRANLPAGAAAVQAARDGAVALLSYGPDTVEKDLGAARGRLTGNFLDAYTNLTNTVVIPGAKQRRISAVATVPAAAVESSTTQHATVLLAVDQSTIIGNDAPTSSAASVRVTLDNIGGRWLISAFDPL